MYGRSLFEGGGRREGGLGGGGETGLDECVQSACKTCVVVVGGLRSDYLYDFSVPWSVANLRWIGDQLIVWWSGVE